MNSRWHIRKHGRVSGPFSTDTIKQMLREGMLDERHEIRREGDGAWQSLVLVKFGMTEDQVNALAAKQEARRNRQTNPMRGFLIALVITVVIVVGSVANVIWQVFYR